VNDEVFLAVDADVVNATGGAALASPEDQISGLSRLAGHLMAPADAGWVLGLGCAGDGDSSTLLGAGAGEAGTVHVAVLRTEWCAGFAGTELILGALVGACAVNNLLRGGFARLDAAFLHCLAFGLESVGLIIERTVGELDGAFVLGQCRWIEVWLSI